MKNEADKSTGIVKKPIKVRTKEDKLSILREATDRAITAYDYAKENMDQAEEDVSFLFGDQYTTEAIQQMDDDNRLALTFNKLPQFINNVVGSQRSTVQTINVSPTGASIGVAEPELETGNGKKIKLSAVLTDLIRDIEYQSDAVSWYQTGFKHALEGGFGWLRVLSKYQDDGFDLDIQIKGVRDRWSVIIDPNAKEPDRSDMNYAFVLEKMDLKEFQKRYPSKSHEAIAGVESSANTLWGTEETVTIAEYFRREPYQKKIVLLSNNEVHNYDDIKDVLDELKATGITVVKERTIQATRVIWSKISAGDILEDDIEFPTTTIPLIPIMGRETDFRDKTRTKGLITDAKDAQLALNRMRSSSLERIDASPLAPFIATDKAIEGYEDMWAEANAVKYSTLIYKKGEQMPVRDQGSTMPVAELQVANVLDGDMKDSVGMQNASIGKQSNEISGKAIRARQSESDVSNYEFIDNYNRALRRVGLLVVEMIPVIYDTERIIRIRGADGESDTVKINQVIKDTQTGKDVVIHDLNYGKHTVIMSTGASYATKMEENADQILSLMQANPQVAQVGSDLLVKNLDFSDSDTLADRLEKTIPLQFLSKEKQAEIQKDMPEPTPSPEQVQAQAEQDKLKLEMQMKQQEMDSKIQLEAIKLETARVNLAIKQTELQGKGEGYERDGKKKIMDSENKRRDGVAEALAKKIEGAETPVQQN